MSRPATVAEWLLDLEQRHPVAIDLGLERIGVVWERLGRPRPGRRLITVAGTNGKGSVVAYADALLRSLGYRAGTYTSPHLLQYNERIVIAGAQVEDAPLLRVFERVEDARGDIRLTYFEFGTLAAFLLLAEADLDFAVLEVGLGGRLDAVNLVAADCAVITPVGLDHQEYLGPDRESIGREKAGIIRPGTPVICGEPEPPQSVLETAGRLGAPLRRLGHEFSICDKGASLRWTGPEGRIDLPQPPLQGGHQSANLATAFAAVAALVPHAVDRPDALARAIGSVRLPGRLQTRLESPLVLVDVGHNPLAAGAVAGYLAGLQRTPRFCVLGMLRDKDAAGVATALDPVVSGWYCCGLAGDRGRSGDALAREVAKVAGGSRVRGFETVEAGLHAALDTAPAGGVVLVFGSFHTAAEALTSLATRAPMHPGSV